VLTFFAGDSWLRSRAAETIREILADPAVHLIPQSHESFLSGLELYASRLDKRATALSIVFRCRLCAKRGSRKSLPKDRHFEQEGFRALFRDS
jgi:uncharacterized protein